MARLRQLYRLHFNEPRRERQFLVSASFLVGVVITRAITWNIYHHVGPFKNAQVGELHIHHLVWGVLLLLLIGYLSVIQIGGEVVKRSRKGRVLAMLYGLGAALTLDEFALLLNLHDVYWTKLGVESIQAMAVFAGILTVALYGGPLARAIARETPQIAEEAVEKAAGEILVVTESVREMLKEGYIDETPKAPEVKEVDK